MIFLGLILACKDIELGYGKTRTRGFFSTVRVVSLTRCMLSTNFSKHSFTKFSGQRFFKKTCIRKN